MIMFKRKNGSIYVIAILLFIIFFTPILSAETIIVGMEPFPPLIVDKNTGYTIDLLKEIESISDLKFTIDIMPYIRAKKSLESGRVDIIAHTPYKAETKDFYNYAQELDFEIETINDFYVTDEAKLKDISKLKIGIPRGNEEFASEFLGIPVANFYLGTTENLLKMLNAGRIDAFWFERASTMLTLKKLQLDNIHYMKFPKEYFAAGIAVKKDNRGTELKKKIDSLINQIDLKRIFKDYSRYLDMPDKGVISSK